MDSSASIKQTLELLEMSGVDYIPVRNPVAKMENDLVSVVKNSVSGPKSALIELRELVLKCSKCDELVKNRTKIVFGSGNAKAELVFVGEAPGRQEDEQGLPFVGEAGQLLTRIIEAMGLKREQVFICNVLKCRPPENRNPMLDEVLNCESYLMRQLEIIQPKVICALGNFPAQTLLKTGRSITSLRGRFHDFHGIPLMCTFHPAYLLRNPSDKRKVWEDMKLVRDFLRRPESAIPAV